MSPGIEHCGPRRKQAVQPRHQKCQGRGTDLGPQHPAVPDGGDRRQSYHPGAPLWIPDPERGEGLTWSSCPARGLESVSDPRISSRIQGCSPRRLKPAIPVPALSPALLVWVFGGRRGHAFHRKRKRTVAGRDLRSRPRPRTNPRACAGARPVQERACRFLLGRLNAGLLILISPSSCLAFGLFIKAPVEGRGQGLGRKEGGIWSLRLRPRVVRASWLEATSTYDPEKFSKYDSVALSTKCAVL